MKKVYLLVSGLIFSSAVMAQEVKNVGIGTGSPDKSAVLDISSEDKGLLIPRLNSKQINAISAPAKGLLVFQTDSENSGFFFFNGEKWSPLTSGEANSIATLDANGWSLTGNAVAVSGSKAAATAESFIGTPNNVPINFKIGDNRAGFINHNNTLLGHGTGSSGNFTGGNNVAIGTKTLSLNTSGNGNTAVGAYALRDNLTGTGNVGLGLYSLGKIVSGSANLGIGTGAMGDKTGGVGNVGIGSYSLENNLTGTGNVGIGYFAGRGKEGDNNIYIGNQAGRNSTGVVTESSKLYIANSATATPLVYGDFSARFVSIGIVPVDKRETVASGGQYSLIVEKGILSEKLKVALKSTGDWADYVFEPEYRANMMPLEEVETFTLKNKHLPNVPSATDLVEKGLDFNETSRMFMEKIEELTLYMIELNKEVKALKAENAKLKTSLNNKTK